MTNGRRWMGWSVLLFVAYSCVARAETVHLTPMTSGLHTKFDLRQPQTLNLSETPPEGLQTEPADLVKPLYGVLLLGPAEHPTRFFVVVDEPDGKPQRLFVDANANGDATDDAPVEWKPRPYHNQDGVERTLYEGEATLQVHYGDSVVPLTLKMMRFDKTDTVNALVRNSLLFYADYAMQGQVALGGKTYAILLADAVTTGDFRGRREGGRSDVLLLIDVNGDGRFDTRGEMFDTVHPFNIHGTTYEVADVSAAGDALTIVKSSRTVPEIPAPPNLNPGKPAPPFQAVTMDHRTIRFPADYRGKRVLLYFWATWCPDCEAELPNVVKAYRAFHSQGLEILGISLDHPNVGAGLARYMRDKKMDWPQVYDGKFWDAAVARRYFVNHTPTPLLVDGDTGEILAGRADLLGPRLSDTLQKFLRVSASQSHFRKQPLRR